MWEWVRVCGWGVGVRERESERRWDSVWVSDCVREKVGESSDGKEGKCSDNEWKKCCSIHSVQHSMFIHKKTFCLHNRERTYPWATMSRTVWEKRIIINKRDFVSQIWIKFLFHNITSILIVFIIFIIVSTIFPCLFVIFFICFITILIRFICTVNMIIFIDIY